MTDYPMHPDPSGLDAWGAFMSSRLDKGECLAWELCEDKREAESALRYMLEPVVTKGIRYADNADYGLVHLVPEQEVERLRGRLLYHIVAFGVADDKIGKAICGTCSRQSPDGFEVIRHEQWCKDAEMLGLDMDPGTPAP